jgi:hypothetical protein
VEPPTLALQAFPAGVEIDAALRQAIHEQPFPIRNAGRSSATQLPYPVLLVDLNGDGQNEAIFFPGYSGVVLAHRGSEWARIGFLNLRNGPGIGQKPSNAQLLKWLQSGKYQLTDSRWKVLQLDGHSSQLTLSDPDLR